MKFKFPHVFVLLLAVIFLCSLLTYIIPSGKFERKVVSFQGMKRTVVIPNTFKKLEKEIKLSNLIISDSDNAITPVSLVQFLSAVPRGMAASSDIIFFIFIIGGVFGLLKETNTVNVLILKMLKTFKDSPALLTSLLMLVLAVGGSTLGMGEEFIPLVPVFILISTKMGYNNIYGVGIVYLGAIVGFAAATTNPFSLNIAQSIAEVPLNSGMLFRMFFFCVAIIIAVHHVLRYGKKVKKLQNKDSDLKELFQKEQEINNKHKAIILIGVLVFVLIIYSVQEYGWWTEEMAGGFLLIGFITVLIFKIPLEKAAKSFTKGMEEMLVAALVVGFARGVQIVLEDGIILDTLIYYASNAMQSFHNILAAQGMLLFQTTLNLLIPSGSGQAAVTMPLMTPLADTLNLSRQTAVFAFTCGDGFSNMVIPTSGLLMAMLGLGGIRYEDWIKFTFPLFIKLMLLSSLFITAAVLIGY